MVGLDILSPYSFSLYSVLGDIKQANPKLGRVTRPNLTLVLTLCKIQPWVLTLSRDFQPTTGIL